MQIVPLPVFEEDADPSRRDALTLEEQFEKLEAPETIVVKFGALKLIGEYKQAGGIKAGCGSKLVARTHRGTELVEMLTTTCSNSGCGKSISRKEMLEYIDNSGGKNFPFYTNGRVIRIATADDINLMSSLQSKIDEQVRSARVLIEEHKLAMKIVDVEPILGGELLTFYFLSEERVDFRSVVADLASKYSTRIEMKQVGSREEARLVADYEKCGQHCCCKGFLKVLSPVSMRTAKQQKETLDPKKISGRCGRLMCCLRYEDQTYRELKKNLPHKKTRVGTAEGPGIVIDGKILTQLVMVELEHDRRRIAVPIEELLDPETCPRPWEEIVVHDKPKPKNKPRRNRSNKNNKDEKQGGNTKGEKQGENAKVEKQGEAKASGTKKKTRRRRRRRKNNNSENSDKT
jgi:cell fate regulator YaaT (PSP1 superfamily)